MQRALMTLAVALCCPLVAAAAPAPVGVPLTADTPGKTASGTAFTAPKSWSETQQATLTILTAPENDTSLAIVEVAKATGAQDAVAQAWNVYRPGVNHPVKLVSKLTAQTDGTSATSSITKRRRTNSSPFKPSACGTEMHGPCSSSTGIRERSKSGTPPSG